MGRHKRLGKSIVVLIAVNPSCMEKGIQKLGFLWRPRANKHHFAMFYCESPTLKRCCNYAKLRHPLVASASGLQVARARSRNAAFSPFRAILSGEAFLEFPELCDMFLLLSHYIHTLLPFHFLHLASQRCGKQDLRSAARHLTRHGATASHSH